MTDIGRAAYAAYSAAVGGTTFDGKALPPVDIHGDTQRQGWNAAGASAGFACKLGDTIRTKHGVSGRVTHFSIGEDRRGVFIDGAASGGQPFELFVREADIANVSQDAA